MEFQRVCQNSKLLNNRVSGEEKKGFLAKRACDVAKTISSNFKKDLSC